MSISPDKFITEQLASLASAAIEAILGMLKPHMELEDIPKEASPAVDKLIRKYKSEGLNFIGGKFQIVLVKPDGFAVGYELFFQDADEQWHKADNLSKKMDARLHLSPTAWNELKTKTIMSWEIADPDMA